MNASKQRSAVKAIVWRCIGTADTFAISWFITKEPITAGAIASFEVVTKTIFITSMSVVGIKLNGGENNV